MKSLDFGGNRVMSLQEISGSETFADDRYRYEILKLENGHIHEVVGPGSICLYLIRGELQLSTKRVSAGQVVLFSGNNFKVLTLQKSELLFASCSILAQCQICQISDLDSVKKVSKPWGHEFWLTGENFPFAFKNIFIKSGTRTSLQYHQMKRESNLLFEGVAKLHFKRCSSVENDQVKDTDIEAVEIKSVSLIDVWPHTLHRLEAISDINLFEVSTPELDDVIRVQDDSRRMNGRISSEHS
ncbi:MAG: hypothetical protein LW875_05290 [Proteobacteria bacterium]|jgi:hypothetical protein|nr:hypothetical protein [Pseudomonadota bacterium]